MNSKKPAVDDSNKENKEDNEGVEGNTIRTGHQKADSPYVLDTEGKPRLDGNGYPVLKLPPETVEDLRPFPLNKHFVSEPVLSEDFRNEIYHRLTKGNDTIRQVSADLQVSIERVAAVYRLKEVEKRWAEKVGTLTFFAITSLSQSRPRMMNNHTNSISLQDTHMVTIRSTDTAAFGSETTSVKPSNNQPN